MTMIDYNGSNYDELFETIDEFCSKWAEKYPSSKLKYIYLTKDQYKLANVNFYHFAEVRTYNY